MPTRGADAERLADRRAAEVGLDQDHAVAGQRERRGEVDRGGGLALRRRRAGDQDRAAVAVLAARAREHRAQRAEGLERRRGQLAGRQRAALALARPDPEPALAEREGGRALLLRDARQDRQAVELAQLLLAAQARVERAAWRTRRRRRGRARRRSPATMREHGPRRERAMSGASARVSTRIVGSPACAQALQLGELVGAAPSRGSRRSSSACSSCSRRRGDRSSASAAHDLLERCATTPFAKPLAMSRASSGESASP